MLKDIYIYIFVGLKRAFGKSLTREFRDREGSLKHGKPGRYEFGGCLADTRTEAEDSGRKGRDESERERERQAGQRGVGVGVGRAGLVNRSRSARR